MEEDSECCAECGKPIEHVNRGAGSFAWLHRDRVDDAGSDGGRTHVARRADDAEMWTP